MSTWNTKIAERYNYWMRWNSIHSLGSATWHMAYYYRINGQWINRTLEDHEYEIVENTIIKSDMTQQPVWAVALFTFNAERNGGFGIRRCAISIRTPSSFIHPWPYSGYSLRSEGYSLPSGGDLNAPPLVHNWSLVNVSTFNERWQIYSPSAIEPSLPPLTWKYGGWAYQILVPPHGAYL